LGPFAAVKRQRQGIRPDLKPVGWGVAFSRNPWREVIDGLGTPPPVIQGLMITLALGCVADMFHPLQPVMALLRLDPAVYEAGQLWRLVTYGLVGTGGIGAWSIVQLVLVYWLTMQLVTWIGLRRTQTMLLGGIAVSGLAAVGAHAGAELLGAPPCAYPFGLMQGQSIVIAIGLAGFSAANRYSTVRHTPYVYGLPIPTKWLVPLQLMLAFAGAVATNDVGSFVGIATASAWGWRGMSTQRPRPARS
jgi:hypothetical protein